MTRIFFTICLALIVSPLWAQYNVTFQVDMQQVTVGGQVSVAGNFQVAAGFPTDWDPASTAMTDPNTDDVYTVTVNIPAGTYEYKFLNGNTWGNEETVPVSCAVNNNRSITISSDTVITAFCFGSCMACPSPPDTLNVTFAVDMRDEIINGTVGTVSVAGSFQSKVIGQFWSDWDPAATTLTDPDGDSVYTATLRFPEGYYEYKFINGITWGDAETVPASCEMNTNRYMTLDSSNYANIYLPEVCFASCAPCVVVTPPDTLNVTFAVDMRDEIINGTVDSVSITGSFQSEVAGQTWTDWTPGVTLMTDPDGDSVYTVTLRIIEGFYEYKFINGTTWGNEEIVPSGCQWNLNRYVILDSTNNSNIYVPEVCFASCSDCPIVIQPDTLNITFAVDMRDEIINGTVGTVSLAGSFQSEVVGQSWSDWTPGVTLMTDPDGDSVYTVTLRFVEGFYEYKFINGTTWGQDETVPAGCQWNNNRFMNIDTSNNSTVFLDEVCFSSCSDCAPILNTAYLNSNNLILQVVPNPFEMATTLQLFGNNTDYTVQLFNISGQLVQSRKGFGEKPLEIERNNLKAGIYFLQVQTTEGKQLNHKIIVR